MTANRGNDDVALVAGDLTDDPKYMEYTREMAIIHGLEWRETPGDLGWLRRLLMGKGDGVRVVAPGEVVDLRMYTTD